MKQTNLVKTRAITFGIKGDIAILKGLVSVCDVFNKDIYLGIENFQNKK